MECGLRIEYRGGYLAVPGFCFPGPEALQRGGAGPRGKGQVVGARAGGGGGEAGAGAPRTSAYR